MSTVRLSDEAAQAVLADIETDLDIQPGKEEQRVVLRAIRGGRLEWDASEQTFMVTLAKPIQLDNGATVDTVTVTEPDAGQMKKASATKDDFEQSLKLVSYATGQPIGYIERLKLRDLNLLGALVGFFG